MGIHVFPCSIWTYITGKEHFISDDINSTHLRYSYIMNHNYYDMKFYTTQISLLYTGNVAVTLKVQFSHALSRISAWTLTVNSLSSEWHKTSLMRSHHSFRQWLDAVRRHQAIAWASVDPDLRCHIHMASPGCNELTDVLDMTNIFNDIITHKHL